MHIPPLIKLDTSEHLECLCVWGSMLLMIFQSHCKKYLQNLKHKSDASWIHCWSSHTSISRALFVLFIFHTHAHAHTNINTLSCCFLSAQTPHCDRDHGLAGPMVFQNPNGGLLPLSWAKFTSLSDFNLERNHAFNIFKNSHWRMSHQMMGLTLSSVSEL